MKRFFKIIAVLALIVIGPGATFSGSVLSSSQDRRVPKALFLGASNTGGQSTDVRLFAWRKEFQDVVGIGTYQIVGDFQSPLPSDPLAGKYDLDHSGIGGETSAQIELRFINDVDQYMTSWVPGDFVVIEAGKNDSNLNSIADRDGARDNIEDMIDYVHAHEPRIDVYVLTVEPVNEALGTMFNSDIVLFNSAVSTMVTTYQATKNNVYLVDTYNAFIDDTTGICSSDWLTNCWQDHKHPNALGYRVMGQVIANSALNCLTESQCN